MVKKTILYLSEKYGVQAVVVELSEEILGSDDRIVEAYRKVLAETDGIMLAVIDHISSVPSLIFPIEKLIPLFKERAVPVAVDGAHAFGQIALNLREYDADFYFSNVHKWGFAPKSVCFLHVSPHFKEAIHPNIIGNFYGEGFQREFFWTGTRDYSSYLTVRDSLSYLRSLGPNEVIAYNH